MNRFLLPISALAAFILAACGGTNQTFTLSPGTYTLTTTEASPDACKLQSMPTPVIITVAANGTVTLTDVGGQPSGTLQGNDASLTSVHNVDNNDPNVQTTPFNCVEKITKTIAISLTANNAFSGTQQYHSEIFSGNACLPANLGYSLPCDSTLKFTAA
jgi:hypothetical protein